MHIPVTVPDIFLNLKKPLSESCNAQYTYNSFQSVLSHLSFGIGKLQLHNTEEEP
jgi:hypothetical protein